ncbi:hypothetical protein GLOTRDRAFT_68379 [Gloeophyllum trabeum ATCC 11539]|uniref:Glycosyltransferase family 32 protein n=1 Tax=Gloeophyllum trabeum (strain ATCC 11539 / FP-39264 / Madison 617) TaxID=670483 RepID=S7QMB3_GLOTA|nr:uncharacterized protein GLOTRDRAFT_68379 [Gloeophyllum trabeum ATCC 11539]EPQ60603.1 hypothetical protein GLOTRDRAFT_68379 [Gloeophyllum trabeum ATCC 11539]
MPSISIPPPRMSIRLGDRARPSNGLPIYSNSAVEEKRRRHGTAPLFIIRSVPIPGVSTRRLRIPVLNPLRLQQCNLPRPLHRPWLVLSCLALFLIILTIFPTSRRRWDLEEKQRQWKDASPFASTTLVFKREDLKRIWGWEIQSGHYPSGHKLPKELDFLTTPVNPAYPPNFKKADWAKPDRFRSPVIVNTKGIGPNRNYVDVQARFPDVGYPPRPIPGSIADLDVIMAHCDFSENKYVRDCLEVLRIGAGLDNQARLRRGNIDEWKYIYVEEGNVHWDLNITEPPHMGKDAVISSERNPSAELSKKRGVDWEPRPNLRPAPKYEPYHTLSSPCDPENPRVFHMFWAGDFTDKPYMSLLSFLFTQNLGLHLPETHTETHVCRPQLWMWINPGPAASVPNEHARRDMFDKLRANPWSAPFLHPRFRDAIQFKMWNTTEQLDAVPELRDDWRARRDSLFNSGGHVYNVPIEEQQQPFSHEDGAEGEESEGDAAGKEKEKEKQRKKDMKDRVGSQSPEEKDGLSTILSDMARFVLCHRFGGIYLDADTILLRDWEELWGWHGAFAYRWSRLKKYNTAVLKMGKGSALGTFLLRTAVKNGFDFHPMTISDYTKDAYLEELLLRLPDALFDSAWLNTENYQNERPPQPYFESFRDFFSTPQQQNAQPGAVGFHGFFKGAYSYHYHGSDFWSWPFDPARNWPDLGPRFDSSERAARSSAAVAKHFEEDREDMVSDDKRDLDWSTVILRTFEAYIRGERPNMYGEWLTW